MLSNRQLEFNFQEAKAKSTGLHLKYQCHFQALYLINAIYCQEPSRVNISLFPIQGLKAGPEENLPK